jgi:hypothetical protein
LSSADEVWVVVAVLFTACSITASAEESPPPLTLALSLFLASALPPSDSASSLFPVALLLPTCVVVAVLSPVSIVLA